MRLLRRRCSAPRSKTIRPAEPYLLAGAEEARRLGHNYVGTEHLLLVLVRNREGRATKVLGQLGVTPEAVEEELRPCLGVAAPRIDPDALAALGIDFDAVRERLEQSFGSGALETSRAGCLGVAPRAKQALAHAVDYAGEEPVDDAHVLLGMLAVSDSLAVHVLRRLGVSLRTAEATVRPAR